MTDPRLDRFRDFLTSLAPLPEDEWKAFASALHLSKLATGESFLRSGGSSAKAGFVLSGLLKVFYLTGQGDEYIRNFAPEHSLVVALKSQLTGNPLSDVNAVALEPCEMLEFDYMAYHGRIARHWTWQQIGRKMTEHHYLMRERRQFELLTLAAEERVMLFMRQFPGLAARISQKDLAGYIGVTPVSLSRIRGKLKLAL